MDTITRKQDMLKDKLKDKLKDNLKPIGLLSKMFQDDKFKLDTYDSYENCYYLDEDKPIFRNVVKNKCSECPDIPNFPPMNTPPDDSTKLAYMNIFAHRSLDKGLNGLSE